MFAHVNEEAVIDASDDGHSPQLEEVWSKRQFQKQEVRFQDSHENKAFVHSGDRGGMSQAQCDTRTGSVESFVDIRGKDSCGDQ